MQVQLVAKAESVQLIPAISLPGAFALFKRIVAPPW